MFTVVKSLSGYGRVRRDVVTLPLVTALLDEPGFKYLVLPYEPEPTPPCSRASHAAAARTDAAAIRQRR